MLKGERTPCSGDGWSVVESGFELDLSYFDFYHFDKKPNFYNEKLVKLFGKPRQKNKQISKRHFQIAGALQRAFEQIVLHLVYITKKLGGNSGAFEHEQKAFQTMYRPAVQSENDSN